MKLTAVNLAVVILAVLLLVVVWRFADRKHRRPEHFDNVHYLTISWSPPAGYPFPQNLDYNWAYCTVPGTGCSPYEGWGLCATPPSDPTTWKYHGSVSTPSLTLNSATCGECSPGCQGTLMLQAVDSVTKLAGPWVATTIDLSSPAPKSVSITDASGQPLAEGTTNFEYQLALDPSAFAAGNKAFLNVSVYRGASVYGYAGYVPFTSVSGGTGSLTGSLTATTLWANGQAPGPLQLNDKLEVLGEVYSPAKDGPVYYWGTFSATATAVTPGSPAQVAWVLS